jgi:hypothetical protein
MENYFCWAIIPLAGTEKSIKKTFESILNPYAQQIKKRIEFELTDGESGIDDDEVSDDIHDLFNGGPLYWEEFDEIPSKNQIVDMFWKYVSVCTQDNLMYQNMYPDTADNSITLLVISSDSDLHDENEHCEVVEFLRGVLAPSMAMNYSTGGCKARLSNGEHDIASYVFGKDGDEIHIKDLMGMMSKS